MAPRSLKYHINPIYQWVVINQYDPPWCSRIGSKSGRAQAEFMKNFGVMTNQTGQSFNPLETLREFRNTRQTQSNMMENISSAIKSMDTMLTSVKCFHLSWIGVHTKLPLVAMDEFQFLKLNEMPLVWVKVTWFKSLSYQLQKNHKIRRWKIE